MASIIRMTSSEFLKKFSKKYNYKHYNFILVSEDIKNNKKHGNVYSIPELMPKPKALTKWFDNKDWKGYYKAYYQYLGGGNIEIYITTLVKLCVMEGADVILLCSDQENEYKYLKALCTYIEHVYGVNTYTFKQYDKKPKKCKSVIDKKSTVKVITKKIKTYQKYKISADSADISKKEMKAKLKNMDKDSIKKIAKKMDIKTKGKGKSELIAAIASKSIH